MNKLIIKTDTKEIKINEFTYSQRKIVIMPNDSHEYVKKPIGKEFTIITSKMPKPLLDAINQLIDDYCN